MIDPSEIESTKIDHPDGSCEIFGPLKYEVTPPPTKGDVTITPVDPGNTCWFPPPRLQTRQDPNGQHFRLRSMPYWLLTGGYAGVWLGGLAAWQRRKARLLKVSTAPLP